MKRISPGEKHFITILSVVMAMLVAMSPLATDTYLSAMPLMASFFGVHISYVEISLTIYFLGFAIGNFAGGPLSDSFGRKRIALIGIVLYGICATLIPLQQSIYMVWLFRALQAFGGGFASVTAMVIVKDLYDGKQVAKIATLIGMIMMLAPLFAPIIGSTLLNAGSWKTIFYFLSVYAVLILLVFGFVMQESRSPELITKKLTTAQFFEKYRLFFQHRKAVLMLFTLSFSVAGMFVFLTSSSFIYLKYFGYEEAKFPLLFGANVVLNVILSMTNSMLLKKNAPERLLQIGLGLQLLAGTFLGFIVLFVEPNIWMVFAGIVLYIGSLGMVFGNGNAIILNLVPQISGAANATVGVTRFLLSFIVGSIPSVIHTGNLKPIGITMFVCVLLSVLFFTIFKQRK